MNEYEDYEYNNSQSSLTKLQVAKMGILGAIISKSKDMKENVEFKEYADEVCNLEFIKDKLVPLLLEASEMNENTVPEKQLEAFIKKVNNTISIVDFSDLSGDEINKKETNTENIVVNNNDDEDW